MKLKNCKHLLGAFILTFVITSQVTAGESSTPVTEGTTPAITAHKNTTHVNQKVVHTATQAVQVKHAKPRHAATALTRVKTNKNAHTSHLVDYVKRVMYIHNILCKRIPQRLIDSNRNMLDSIRAEIAKRGDEDSLSFLKTALKDATNDSITLANITAHLYFANGDKAAQNTGKGTIIDTGTVNVYCTDLNTLVPMDSVKVDIYNHDSLVATAYSGNDGFCKFSGLKTTGLKPDTYSLTFSKNNYTTFSDRWVSVTAGNVTNLEMPLTQIPRFYLPKFSPGIWAMIFIIVISVFFIIYTIIRRLERVA